MKLLCLSNGHGEDAIGLRVLQALQQYARSEHLAIQPPTQLPIQPLELAALPIVGQGRAYLDAGIPIVGTVKSMPSGGFLYMDSRQLVRDLKGGLLPLTLAQLKVVRHWAKSGGVILAVGDVVPLLFAWWSGAPYAFVGTARSEYYLRDEQGWLPRKSWFERLENWAGSVYLPWERWLMRQPQCQAVFPRDQLTTAVLRQWAIPAYDLGNPMMDGLETAATDGVRAIAGDGVTDGKESCLTFVLLPGSRAPEAYENWKILIQAVSSLLLADGNRPLRFLAAIAPQLDFVPLRQTLEGYGWRVLESFPQLVFGHHQARLVLTNAFQDCLQRADLALAMAGTATEQFVGLGKPALTFPGMGPQFTPKFAEAQTRLLGAGVTLVEQPHRTAAVVQALLQDPDRLQVIQSNGIRRMGTPGAAARIAQCLVQQCFIQK